MTQYFIFFSLGISHFIKYFNNFTNERRKKIKGNERKVKIKIE